MAFAITHFYEGGTEEQYRAVLAAAHPGDGKLPPGQPHHFAGPAEGGWLIFAVWDSEDDFKTFVADTLMPALQTTEGGFAGPPDQRSFEVANAVSA